MDHGASRHYTSPGFLLFFFPLPLAQCKAHAENTARKNATASVPIPASTAQCTRQKHPLNIGVFGPRRGKSTRVKPLWSFGHLSVFAVLFFCLSSSQFRLLSFVEYSLLSISLFRFFSLNQRRMHTLILSSKSNFPLFSASSPLTVSLIPFSSSSRRFSGFLAHARDCFQLCLLLLEAHGDKRYWLAKMLSAAKTAQQF